MSLISFFSDTSGCEQHPPALHACPSLLVISLKAGAPFSSCVPTAREAVPEMALVPSSSIQMPTSLDFGKELFLLPPSKSSVTFKNPKRRFEHISERNEMRTGQILLECSTSQSADKTIHVHALR